MAHPTIKFSEFVRRYAWTLFSSMEIHAALCRTETRNDTTGEIFVAILAVHTAIIGRDQRFLGVTDSLDEAI